MKQTLVVHYSEIGTKGQNRCFFERRLRDDIQNRLAPRHVENVRIESGRVLADLTPSHQPGVVTAALEQVFGVAWFAFARTVSWEWEDIVAAADLCAADHPAAKTFKVFCRRADKTFPLSSQAVAIRLGRIIGEKFKLKADMSKHDLPLHVEVLPDKTAAVFSRRFPGLRGMPRGSSGRLLCLFSGGIDSPVAAWLMMRRGALVHLLHFHPFRNAAEMGETKIQELHRLLRVFNPASRLYLIPHYHYHVKASLEVDPAYEMVLFRRFMFKTADALARRKNFKALITGDSLGQVASQTVENIAAAQVGLSRPIFLPLIGHDKEEIVALAQKIGTYEPSIQEYKDCCSLLTRKPKTRVKVEAALALEEKLNFPELIWESLRSMEVWDGATLSASPLPAI